MKTKYPIEALALCVIFYSANTAQMLMAGMVVALSLCFSAVFAKNKSISAILGGIICFAGLVASFWYIGFISAITDLGKPLAVAIVCELNAREISAETEANDVVYYTGISLAIALILSAIREMAAFGGLFTFELFKTGFIASAYQKLMFGFITAAIFTAIVSKIFKTCSDSDGIAAVSLAIAMGAVTDILSSQALIKPFIIALLALIGFYSVSQRIKFSDCPKHFGTLPLNLAATGFIYMILTVI